VSSHGATEVIRVTFSDREQAGPLLAPVGAGVPRELDLDEIQHGIETLVRMAIEAATGLDELVDCARAAASLGTPELLALVADHVRVEVDEALASSGAWEAELTYSKLDAWQQTGHKARLLAEAWGYVKPLLAK
jgi:hypothetical protein